MTPDRSFAVLLCAAALAGCGKDAVQSITAPASGAAIKFVNLGVNSPSVNFYANDVKLTAIPSASGAESTLGTGFGNQASGGYYSALSPGQYTLSGKVSAATDNGLAISKVATTLADGKYYSFYQTGFYDPAAKAVDAFVVEDLVTPQIDYTTAYVRLVNAISNANPMTLYARNPVTGVEVAIGGAVPYKSAGAFTAIPDGVYDLSTRYVGSASNVISRASQSFSAGHVYSVGARGDITVVSTSATNRPFLENDLNR